MATVASHGDGIDIELGAAFVAEVYRCGHCCSRFPRWRKLIENTSMSLATVILASSNLLLLVLMALKSRKRKLGIADKG